MKVTKKICISLLLLPFIALLIVMIKPSAVGSINDIYRVYPLESSIDSIFSNLPERNIFALTPDYVITTYNMHEKTTADVRADHLLFYGRDLKLKYACFFPLSFDSIKGTTIYGSYMDHKQRESQEERYSAFRSDIPPGYGIEKTLRDGDANHSSGLYTLHRIDMRQFPKVALHTSSGIFHYQIEGLEIFDPYRLEGRIHAKRKDAGKERIDRFFIGSYDTMDKFYDDLYREIQSFKD